MSDYKIKSIGKVDFRTYKDVIRVIAIKERGFWTSGAPDNDDWIFPTDERCKGKPVCL